MKVLVGLLVLLLLVLQYRLWFGDGSVQEVWRLNQQADQTKAELQRLRSRNQALEAEVADLKSGLDAIEERARSELGMIDEDETFYQFVQEKSQTVSVTPRPDQARTVKVPAALLDQNDAGAQNATSSTNGTGLIVLDPAAIKIDANGNQLIDRNSVPLVSNGNDQ